MKRWLNLAEGYFLDAEVRLPISIWRTAKVWELSITSYKQTLITLFSSDLFMFMCCCVSSQLKITYVTVELKIRMLHRFTFRFSDLNKAQ